ncbi:MAG: hypothetical protein F6J90_09505 [Moorea sp. SIOASIH]|uniref:hypothetical protein n=1 Tax=Moorena sp. SIOASIH TaxID=2607817 RepID=UPI0013BCF08F|nr:hypothetical protein [Moorena sp. SIOASIH]NEO36544.1 hypothetical protein [Moorena sp. SIOASIH]
MRYTGFFPCSLFPSWEGLGVGSSSLFPVPCSLFPSVLLSRLPTPDSLLPTPYSRLPTPKLII